MCALFNGRGRWRRSSLRMRVAGHEQLTVGYILEENNTKQLNKFPHKGPRTKRIPDLFTLGSFLSFFLADTCPFLGPLVPLFWISGDVSSGFQSQSGLPYSHCGGKHNVRSPRSTSGATLADLLAAGTQPVLSPHTVAEVRLPGFELVLSEYL